MVLFNGPTSSGSSTGPGGPGPTSGSTGTASGAQSLPYISRSLSIDAYVSQQQLEMGSKKSINTSNRTSELEEYAKRYEAIGKNLHFYLFPQKMCHFKSYNIFLYVKIMNPALISVNVKDWEIAEIMGGGSTQIKESMPFNQKTQSVFPHCTSLSVWRFH